MASSFQEQLSQIEEALREAHPLIHDLTSSSRWIKIDAELEKLNFIEDALQRRMENRTRLKSQIEVGYGEWLAKNRWLVARFETRLGQKRAAIQGLSNVIASLAVGAVEEERIKRSTGSLTWKSRGDGEHLGRTEDSTSR